jgi:hypothetical protein
MGAIVEGITVRLKMTEELSLINPDCQRCGEPLDTGVVVWFEPKTQFVFHLKECRRAAVKEAIKQLQLTPNEAVTRFGLLRPTASAIVNEVRRNGSY